MRHSPAREGQGLSRGCQRPSVSDRGPQALFPHRYPSRSGACGAQYTCDGPSAKCISASESARGCSSSGGNSGEENEKRTNFSKTVPRVLVGVVPRRDVTLRFPPAETARPARRDAAAGDGDIDRRRTTSDKSVAAGISPSALRRCRCTPVNRFGLLNLSTTTEFSSAGGRRWLALRPLLTPLADSCLRSVTAVPKPTSVGWCRRTGAGDRERDPRCLLPAAGLGDPLRAPMAAPLWPAIFRGFGEERRLRRSEVGAGESARRLIAWLGSLPVDVVELNPIFFAGVCERGLFPGGDGHCCSSPSARASSRSRVRSRSRSCASSSSRALTARSIPQRGHPRLCLRLEAC
jgi:hypothetical protein